MQENYAIYAKNINKIFKNFWGKPKVQALKDVDLVVKKGSTFGLLGPNGAGKSTLIKIILGHLYPTSGKISVLDKSPRNVQAKHQIGYLPESSHFYKSLTATETLHYFGGLLNLDKKRIQTRSDQLLEMVGLARAKSRPIGDYSHGMTRRMGLAQALLNDPDLLILDEPTAGLDPLGCREIKDLINNLSKRGKTILITSHILADIEDVCDEAMILFNGSVQESGKIKEMLTNKTIQQLSFNKISDDKLAEILNLLKNYDLGTIDVSSPQQNLESFFLNLIRQKTKEIELTGAETGQGIAQYLQQQNNPSAQDVAEKEQQVVEKKEIIADLTKQDENDKEKIDEKLLDKLTKK